MVSEPLRSEMGPPTVTQRVEQLEEKITDLESSVSEMVSKAVERAVEAMHHSLSEMLLEGQAKITKQVGADLDSLAGRLEGRVQRTREFHETLINSMKNDQIRFQSEMRSTMTGLQVGQVPAQNKLEGSVNKMTLTPNSMAALVNSESFGQGFSGRQVEGSSGQMFDGGGYGGYGGYGGIGGVIAGGSGGSPLGVNNGGTVGMGGWRYRKLDMPIFEGTDPDG